MIHVGHLYEYNDKMGAVRRRNQPGVTTDKWHVCDLCRLPGAKTLGGNK